MITQAALALSLEALGFERVYCPQVRSLKNARLYRIEHKQLSAIGRGDIQLVLCDELQSPSSSNCRELCGELASAGVDTHAIALILPADPATPPLRLRKLWAVSPLSSIPQDFAAHVSSTTLWKWMRAVLHPVDINPYQSEQAVVPAMFFGRGDLVDDLCAMEKNYMIVGARRIGKTCVGQKVVRDLLATQATAAPLPGMSSEAPLRTAVYYDMNELAPKNLDELWKDLLRVMQVSERDLQPGSRLRKRFNPSWREPKQREVTEQRPEFDLIVRLLRHRRRRALLVLDECDAILERDRANNFQLFRGLQFLVDDPAAHVRVLLIGYERLLHAYESDLPLNNKRVYRKNLTSLTLGEVESLVAQPLGDLDVRIEDAAEVFRRIHQYTGGMPNLVQDLCRSLLELPDVNATKRVTAAQVDRIIGEDDFRSRIDFLFRQVEAPLPRLVAYLAAQRSDVVHESMMKELRTRGLDVDDRQLQKALQQLKLYGVMTSDAAEETFHFSTDVLTRHVLRNLRISGSEDLLQTLVRQVQTSPSLGLHTERVRYE
jgi:hypothetical protein